MTRLGDGHLGRPREQVGQTALVPGVQVLDEDERHARVGAQVLKQLRERIEPAGGRADADDRKPAPSAPGIHRAERHFLRRLAPAADQAVAKQATCVFVACRSCLVEGMVEYTPSGGACQTG